MQPPTTAGYPALCLSVSILDSHPLSVLYTKGRDENCSNTAASHAEGQSTGGEEYVSRSIVLGFARKQSEAFGKVGLDRHGGRRRRGRRLHRFNRGAMPANRLVPQRGKVCLAEAGRTRGNPVRDNTGRTAVAPRAAVSGPQRRGWPCRLSSHAYLALAEGGLK